MPLTQTSQVWNSAEVQLLDLHLDASVCKIVEVFGLKYGRVMIFEISSFVC